MVYNSVEILACNRKDISIKDTREKLCRTNVCDTKPLSGISHNKFIYFIISLLVFIKPSGKFGIGINVHVYVYLSTGSLNSNNSLTSGFM